MDILSNPAIRCALGPEPESVTDLVAVSRTGIVDRLRDPRYYQIVVLSGLLTYGITSLGFRVSLAEVGAPGR